MLIYHPIGDPYHCIYRLLSVLLNLSVQRIEWEKLRILDFYMLFPHLLQDVKLPAELRGARSQLNKIMNPYEVLPSPKRLMFELSKIQDNAVKSLVAKGIVDRTEFVQEIVLLNSFIIPQKLKTHISSQQQKNEYWYKFLTSNFASIPLMGEKGLKERTGLMEYRYDII